MSYFISAHASLLSLLALSYDRYVAVVKAIKYRLYLSWSRCIKISIGIWLLSITVPFAYFGIGYSPYLMYYGNTTILIGFVIMITIYIKIKRFFKKLCRPMEGKTSSTSLTRQDSNREIERKVTSVFFTIIMVFIVTYISAAIINYTVHFCNECSCVVQHVLRDAQFLFVVLNCCVNPFICMRLTQYRSSINELIKNIPCSSPGGHRDVPEKFNSGSFWTLQNTFRGRSRDVRYETIYLE